MGREIDFTRGTIVMVMMMVQSAAEPKCKQNKSHRNLPTQRNNFRANAEHGIRVSTFDGL